MRALMLVTAILGVGCASPPTNPQTASSAAPLALTDAGRLAAAKNLNLKPIEFCHGFPHPARHDLLYG
jgi:hypothetical protein